MKILFSRNTGQAENKKQFPTFYEVNTIFFQDQLCIF